MYPGNEFASETLYEYGDKRGGVKILIKRQIDRPGEGQIAPFNILNGSEQFVNAANALGKATAAELVT